MKKLIVAVILAAMPALLTAQESVINRLEQAAEENKTSVLQIPDVNGGNDAAARRSWIPVFESGSEESPTLLWVKSIDIEGNRIVRMRVQSWYVREELRKSDPNYVCYEYLHKKDAFREDFNVSLSGDSVTSKAAKLIWPNAKFEGGNYFVRNRNGEKFLVYGKIRVSRLAEDDFQVELTEIMDAKYRDTSWNGGGYRGGDADERARKSGYKSWSDWANNNGIGGLDD